MGRVQEAGSVPGAACGPAEGQLDGVSQTVLQEMLACLPRGECVENSAFHSSHLKIHMVRLHIKGTETS